MNTNAHSSASPARSAHVDIAAPRCPLVSIALATYNGERYLEELLASIEAQDHENLEIVIADDGSSDGTLDLIARRVWRRPHRVLPAASRAGVIGNFSRALAACSGRYVALADQDDVWNPRKISFLVERLSALEADHPTLPALVFSDIEVVDSRLHRIAPSFFALDAKSTSCCELQDFLLTNHVPGCSMLFNRELLNRAMPIPREFHMHDWWLIAVASAFGHVAFVDRPLLQYRQHAANVFGAVERRSSFWQKASKAWSPSAWRKYLLPSQERIAYTVRNIECIEDRFSSGLPARAASQLRRFRSGGHSLFAAFRHCRTARTGESLLYSIALLRAATTSTRRGSDRTPNGPSGSNRLIGTGGSEAL